MNIDYDKLRKDLKDYFGCAVGFMPVAIMDAIRVENATDEELVEIAIQNNVNISEYEVPKIFKL